MNSIYQYICNVFDEIYPGDWKFIQHKRYNAHNPYDHEDCVRFFCSSIRGSNGFTLPVRQLPTFTFAIDTFRAWDFSDHAAVVRMVKQALDTGIYSPYSPPDFTK
jgi:hypothetical protein